MNPLRLVLCAIPLASVLAAHAIQPVGAPPPGRPALADTDVVERGGTIDGVEGGKQLLLVDGVVYAIPRGSVRIHLPGNRISTSMADLRRGMQIRFTSQRDYGTQQVHVREIWVTGVRGR
jgi:hypothetical protein